MHIAKKVSRAFLLLSIAATLLAAFFHERVFYDDLGSFYSNTYPLRDDDRDYFYIAQSFWGIPHDPKLTAMPPEDGEFFSKYPMRGIGAGTPMIALYSIFGFEWRKPFVLMLTILTTAALILGIFGFYLLFGHGLYSLVFIAAFLKFSPGASPDMVQGAEGLVKALLIWNSCALLLLLGALNTKWKRVSPLLMLFLFLGVVYISLVKTQWWIGAAIAGLLLLCHFQTRKSGYVLLVSCLCAFLLIRCINFFHYERNTEFFSSSGLMSLRLARGTEIVSYGCENKLFPPNASAYLCTTPPRNYTWHEVIRNITPMSEVLTLAVITSKIDKIVLIKYWPETIKNFWGQAISSLKYLVHPRQPNISYTRTLFLLFIIPLFFLWVSKGWDEKRVVLLCFCTFSLLPFFASFLVAPWIERYAGPICVFFYLTPIMGVTDLFLPKLISKMNTTFAKFSTFRTNE